MSGALGRRVPQDFTHVEKYPLTASTAPAAPTPMAIGVTWYSAFDNPTRDSQGHYWVARNYRPGGSLGSIRGGHCVCLKARGASDLTSWWDFYDQGAEGACVGFGCSRMMTNFNRKRYVARWLWDLAKQRDEWSDTNPGDDNGTSVHAGFDVLRDAGHVPWSKSAALVEADWQKRDQLSAVSTEGISANRWATTVDEVLGAVGYQDLEFVDFINSWGRGYPHITRMPVTVVERLLKEDGEFGVPTDR
jgi:hypothetical protein